MELQEAMEKRRSIRAFQAGCPVTRDEIRALLEAASLAPSWKNGQPARYYCVVSPEKAEEIARACLPDFNAEHAENAALVVTAFVSGRSGFSKDGTADNECGNGWGFYDLGLACENLVLKAADMGLGTLIMGIRDGEKLRQMLEIPPEETIAAVIAVGHPAEEPSKPPRKTPDEIARFF
ncbi:MAG: nitroreductase family protein [Oscillospiraceae bacterium]|nr:nitroreductase family protein [Oscillospiraceae bacterium]